MKKNINNYIIIIAASLAFCVVILGAYTRLTNAGLGCPDWPGCYGQFIVPDKVPVSALTSSAKAWTEMIHRYFASTLGIFIIFIAAMAFFKRKEKKNTMVLPLILLGLVIFQGLLGMWTVTLKLFPVVVMGHLLGGLLILSSLWWLWLSSTNKLKLKHLQIDHYRPWAIFGVIILFSQIALGGWVSSNYAGLACVGFPFCNDQLWPTMNFREAFNFLLPIGVNYHGGLLSSSARVTIQMMHRIGALITVLYLGYFALRLLIKETAHSIKALTVFILFLLIMQISLGVINVLKLLPLPIAVAHNAVAVLLFLSMITLTFFLFHAS